MEMVHGDFTGKMYTMSVNISKAGIGLSVFRFYADNIVI